MQLHRGNSKRNLIRRLKKLGRTDLLDAISEGRTTAFDAACEAGIRKRKRPLEFDSNVAKRREFRRHPGRARRDGEMWYGPTHDETAFKSETEARRYWFTHRSRLLASLGRGGQRPFGFWRFEVRLPHPDSTDEQAALLHELGQLTITEEQEWLPIWRQRYTGAVGLRGFSNVRDHLDEAVLPRSLFFKLNAERRAARRRVRELKDAASDPDRQSLQI